MTPDRSTETGLRDALAAVRDVLGAMDGDPGRVDAVMARLITPRLTELFSLRAQAAQTTTDLAAARERIVALEGALKLCLEELEWQTNQTHTCGDPGFECPMQDIHNPDDGHRIARDAARSALSQGDRHNADT